MSGVLLLLLLAFSTSASTPKTGNAASNRVVVLSLAGSVQPGSLSYLKRGVDVASRQRAALIVLELDTPGGLLVSLREMTKVITHSGPPVATYVTPSGARAASAGFFLLLAADVAAMAPGTNTGAAHPVAFGSGERAPREMLEKATSDVAALARSLAAQRDRPTGSAENAVRESRSYTEREALALGLIDVVANSRNELLRSLNGRQIRRFDGSTQTLELGRPTIEHLRPHAGERLLMHIADPQVAYLLLLLGVLALAVELMHPGTTIAGVLGAVSLLLAGYAFSVLPVNFVGALFLAAALACLVAELFIVSHGLLTLAGLVCFVLGSVMLVRTPLPGPGISLWLVLPAALTVAGVMGLLLTRVVSARRAPPLSGVEALVGELGEVVVPLSPSGKVFVHGEYWDAVGQTSAPRGQRVRVTAVEGRTLRVEALAPAV